MLGAGILGACTERSPAATHRNLTDVLVSATQGAGGLPYQLLGTHVYDVPNPVSHRNYQVFVSLPADYDADRLRRYPVLYVTDADYAFPVLRQITRRLNGDGSRIKDFILVGLSYAKGEDGMTSRRRDYTPTSGGTTDAPLGAVYGQAAAYQAYLRRQVFPFITSRFRTDEDGRYFLGHSYGGLLGAHILFSDPRMFAGYILGSPSLWYDHHAIFREEQTFARRNHDLAANVYMYVGEYEQVRPDDPRYAGNKNDMVTDLQAFAKTLRSRQYPSLHLETEVLNDEDHLSVAPRGATHGLERLLSVSPTASTKP